ncbi:hypothetical protein OROHE_016683 [Orobanche hederae]
MAVLHYAAGTTNSIHRSYRQFTSETLYLRKHNFLISSSFASFSANHTRRKNHLRQKILKTLERPIIPKLPPSNPIIHVDSLPFQEKEYNSGIIHEIQESEKSENSVTESEELQEFEELGEFEISEPSGTSLVRSVARNYVLSCGLSIVGAFVFQRGIWVLSSAGTGNKTKIVNGSERNSVAEVSENGEGTSRVKLDSYGDGNRNTEVDRLDSTVHEDKLKMERKIEEIRLMARKAREMERSNSKKSGLYDGGEMDWGNNLKDGIGLEADGRLIKLRKKLGKSPAKMPVAPIRYFERLNEMKDGVDKGDLDERESNGDLFFKKKFRFKGVSVNTTEKPKGFPGSGSTMFKDGNAKKRKGVVGPNVNDGIALEKNNEKQLNGEDVKSRASISSDLDIAVLCDELSNGMDSLEGKRVGDAALALERESGSDIWWSTLPYALVIVMRRGRDGEGDGGFYTLKSISNTDCHISHIVAFEDRRDAINFCYLLQSFFEYLEDFDTDVVPLTVKELNEAAKYYSTGVVVVKKGQLRLYAGQPLADAELALRAMI